MSATGSMDHPQVESLNEARYVCGYPKTGRTWLRFMLGNAIARQFDLDTVVTLSSSYGIVPNESREIMDGQPAFAHEGKIPKVTMTHSQFRPELIAGKAVFLTRDPRDIMVSHWMHDKKHVRLYDGSLSDYIQGSRGISAFAEHLESWAPHLEPEQVSTYEDMRSFPHATFERICSVLNIQIDPVHQAAAVDIAAIDRMRGMEVSEAIRGQHYDPSDPDARRVRRGVVGGFVDYLSHEDLAVIDTQISSLTDSAKDIVQLTGYPVN